MTRLVSITLVLSACAPMEPPVETFGPLVEGPTIPLPASMVDDPPTIYWHEGVPSGVGYGCRFADQSLDDDWLGGGITYPSGRIHLAWCGCLETALVTHELTHWQLYLHHGELDHDHERVIWQQLENIERRLDCSYGASPSW